MNTSRKTAIIAEGVARYAAVQDLTPADRSPEAVQVRREWGIWCDDNPRFVEIAEAEQYGLFNRVMHLDV